jgi:hypothetical protein
MQMHIGDRISELVDGYRERLYRKLKPDELEVE